ncbi:MAG: zinc ABC transporter substrate-binding protein [Planctomycetota bacterium]
MILAITLGAALLAVFLPLGVPGRPPAERRGGAIRVLVSIPPQVFFVEKVGGRRVAARALVGPGQNPHTFEPTPREMTALADAALYFTIGIPFERKLVDRVRASNDRLRVVDSAKGVVFLVTESPHKGEEEARGDEHAHEGGLPDPHIWLDPLRVKTIARNVATALSDADPDHASEYRANLETFERELDDLDARIARTLAGLAGREFYVFHPAWAYFAERYRLVEVSIETMGKEPGAKGLAERISEAKRKGVKAIFVQRQFSTKSARAIAEETGAELVMVDDLSARYIENLEDVAKKIAAALAGEAPMGAASRPGE